MAYQNISDLQLGKALQIHFTNGIRNQLSRDYRDYEQVKMAKVSGVQPREIRFLFQTSLGAAAIQAANPGVSNRAFPLAQQITQSEHIALVKEWHATIEIEYNLWKRAKASPEARYLEPLANEMESKQLAIKRQLAKELYGDGTGVYGTLPANSAAVTSPASNRLVFTLSSADTARGHVGWFELGDIFVLKSATGGASALDTNLTTEPVYWKVISRDRKNNKVVMQGLDANFAPVSNITSVTTQPAAGEVFYRFGQPTIPNLSAISDYGSATEIMAGLETLAAADGRIVHGITMEGATAGTEVDAGGAALDVMHIHSLLDNLKVNVGQGVYKWPKLCMAPEAAAVLIEAREVDRRFISVEDNKRGLRYFAYNHGDDTIECYSSEYVPFKRAYALPEARNGSDKVLEFHGLEFEPVKFNDSSVFQLKPSSSGGHVATMVSYMTGSGVLIAKHPAAIGRLRNFTI